MQRCGLVCVMQAVGVTGTSVYIVRIAQSIGNTIKMQCGAF